ncbi:plasma membrane H+-ATPase [Taxawa tesnikishii (nom. ined.)]|nr:plasma membrane H+-ATPase [Dothideales sp. JES 119]
MGDWISGGVIFGLLLLSAGIGFWQDYSITRHRNSTPSIQSPRKKSPLFNLQPESKSPASRAPPCPCSPPAKKPDPSTPVLEAAYLAKMDEFASCGFRSLGVARKPANGSWEMLGIMLIFDPPRHDTASTIKEARDLGLSIKMLTGDAVNIAKETSKQLGLGTKIYDAECLRQGGDFIESADGFGEVFPQHKYDVVATLRSRGYLVAMTGDGANDAPSLKKADTGIAVEEASEAVRSAADTVFLAPGLGAVIDAIKAARQIFHRVRSYIVYRIALSLHLELFLTATAHAANSVIDANLLVFIAIFADLPTLAIAYDSAPVAQKPVKCHLGPIWAKSPRPLPHSRRRHPCSPGSP